MNKIFSIILLVAIMWPGVGFSQKREKRKKHKADVTAEIPGNAEEVTNLYIDATTAKLKGDAVKATGLFEACLAKNPKHSASMYQLAQLYFEAGDFASAAKYADQASVIEPENKWYLNLLVEIYSKAGQKKELIETCEKLVEMDPGNVDNLYQLANAYVMNEDGNNAINTCNKIEELIGVTEEISLQKQRIYVILKKPELAADELNKLIREFPDQEIRYISMLAETYMDAGKPDQAAEYYQQILSKDPQNPYIHISLSDYYRKKGDKKQTFKELKLGFANPALDIDTKLRVLLTYFTAANAYEENKPDILDLVQILVATHPGNPKAHSMYGDFLMDDKKFLEARDEYRKVIAVDSSRYAVWESLLNVNIQLSDYKALEDESIRAIELFPLYPVPYLFKGISLFERKQYQDAVETFNTGVKLATANNMLLVQFYTYLGDTYNRVKNNLLSDESYEKALKIDPDNSYVLNNYAYYLSLRNENLEKAEIMSAKSVKLDASNPANMDTYGWVLYKLGRYQEAADWVEKAISTKKTPDADLLEHLGDIYFKMGNTEKALINWQKALNEGNGSELLEKKVKEKKLYE